MVTVRPARLDRPLRGVALDPVYSDPHLEEIVRVAAERARHEAQSAGYAAGWAQGRQAAAEKAATERDEVRQQIQAERATAGRHLTQLLNDLVTATHEAARAAATEWTEVADTLADGALQLAAAALGRELRSIDDTMATSVRDALRQLSEPGEAVVHLNPADAALVADTGVPGARVVIDPNLTVGSLLVETPGQRLRHELPAALAAADEVLRS